MCVCVCVCVCVCIYIYIYIYRERERERDHANAGVFMNFNQYLSFWLSLAVTKTMPMSTLHQISED